MCALRNKVAHACQGRKSISNFECGETEIGRERERDFEKYKIVNLSRNYKWMTDARRSVMTNVSNKFESSAYDKLG